MNALLEVLVNLRKSRGFRQVDVARSMGIGQPAISELERGETDVRFSTLLRYAEAVGAQVSFEVKAEIDE